MDPPTSHETRAQRRQPRDPLFGKIEKMIARHGLLREGGAVLAAVSGGPDSVALVTILHDLGRVHGWRVGVAHVNHGLRGADSERDQAFVERLGKTMGVPVHVADGTVAPGGNLEERARTVRYRRLSEIARREGYPLIATGHTRDDQAETVLQRLVRGAGTTGLAGVAPQRRDGVIRPLLEISRDELRSFLRRRGIRFRSDRSNRSPRFTRNRIRLRVLPVLEREINPAAVEALARAASLLREDEEWLEAASRRLLGRLVQGGGIDVGRLLRLAAAAQRRVVRLWLEGARGGLEAIELEHVEGIRELAARGRGRLSLPGGEVGIDSGRLNWGTHARIPSEPLVAELPERGSVPFGAWRLRVRRMPRHDAPAPGKWRALFDEAHVDAGPLGARGMRAGDRLRPIGLGGTKKLQDVFVDAKVPRAARALWPVVHQGEAILWLPGLARAEFASVTAGTRRLVLIEATPPRQMRARTPRPGPSNCRAESAMLPSGSLRETRLETSFSPPPRQRQPGRKEKT